MGQTVMRVGITGHRRFKDPSALAWAEEALREKLRQYKQICGLTSLAKGADQIFACTVLELGGQLEAVLPFPGYGESFDDAGETDGFRELIRRCAKVTTLQFAGSKNRSYLAAGQYVADHCDLLVAVWDGKPAAGLGGTADVVAYARREGKKVYQINPATRASAEVP